MQSKNHDCAARVVFGLQNSLLTYCFSETWFKMKELVWYYFLIPQVCLYIIKMFTSINFAFHIENMTITHKFYPSFSSNSFKYFSQVMKNFMRKCKNLLWCSNTYSDNAKTPSDSEKQLSSVGFVGFTAVVFEA